jgi:hypothetical protein
VAQQAPIDTVGYVDVLMAQQSDDVTSGGRRLIGRHAELAMLRDLLPTSVDDHGTSVTLTGPGGIGKTRLASEMADHAEAAGATVVWGRCSEEAHGTPFWPWVQIVRRPKVIGSNCSRPRQTSSKTQLDRRRCSSSWMTPTSPTRRRCSSPSSSADACANLPSRS